jgi:hypothetical protein
MQRYFYATKEDLLPILEKVERRHGVAYTLMGLSESSERRTFYSGAAVPTLGRPAPHPNAGAGYAYLVTPADVPIVNREFPQRAGGILHVVDQLANPISITFTHGGFYAAGVLLYGRVATCSNHPTAAKLFRAFASAVAKNFTRIRAFYVGPNATELFHRGCRLTIGANSPRDYDLTAEPQPKTD